MNSEELMMRSSIRIPACALSSWRSLCIRLRCRFRNPAPITTPLTQTYLFQAIPSLRINSFSRIALLAMKCPGRRLRAIDFARQRIFTICNIGPHERIVIGRTFMKTTICVISMPIEAWRRRVMYGKGRLTLYWRAYYFSSITWRSIDGALSSMISTPNCKCIPCGPPRRRCALCARVPYELFLSL